MAKHIHIHFTHDAWEENKHPRKEDGKFGSGGGGKAAPAKSSSGPDVRKMTYLERMKHIEELENRMIHQSTHGKVPAGLSAEIKAAKAIHREETAKARAAREAAK